MRLKAIIANGNTCVNQIKWTNSNGLVSISLNELNSFVSNLLIQVKLHILLLDQFISKDQLPPWAESEDVSSLHTSEFHVVDVFVAIDGTENFIRMVDAMLSSPFRITRRYVIHVKNWVYNEHIIVDQDEWNIVIV
ncbi:pectinesterase/pectinesterase inhibitor PPE8B-like [Vicia villosa]|uniref:pectinesterase/pectinesterase inhibitor PPE8B-like n=1 Tax=Vicia villosa TaxID=3911 RepID=UPI00273C7BC0|nr:pectinesterase/pectinesterase inhibitor PPE8B-like [Vicia villosa]XP_058768944.1 pectinesterase/pectinesterase inhibitor PPE8B-like [Vicia villosa]